MVDQIDCYEVNRPFINSPDEATYPREMLLRLVLMSVFDGEMSFREIERKTRTDVSYMYLAGMEKQTYRTLI